MINTNIIISAVIVVGIDLGITAYGMMDGNFLSNFPITSSFR